VFFHEELNKAWTYIDELHCIPNIQEGLGSPREPRNGHELYEIDAQEKCLVGYVACVSKDRSCSLCYALETTNR
jgi:hypothetical protein